MTDRGPKGATAIAAGLLLLLAACGGDGASESDGAAEAAPGADVASDGAPPLRFPTEGRRPRGEGPPRGEGSAATPTVQEDSEQAPEVTDVRMTAEEAIDRTLTARVEAIVASGVERARVASSGAVTADSSAVAIVAVDAATGRVILRRLSKVALAPASNMKLLTVAAALVTLGADGAFSTRFESNAPVVGGVLDGDLVVRAGGDPMHRREGDGSLDAWIDPLAEALAREGIQRVSGTLVLDEGRWLEPGPGPQWPSPSEHWRDYCALAGGFSANGGCFRATITPTAPGSTATVVLRPRNHGLTRKGRVTTEGRRIAVNVGANRSGVTVRGKIRADASPYRTEFAHPDPVDLFGHAVVGGLAEHGIPIDGGFARARGHAVADARSLHVVETPIQSVLEAILLDSNNPVADQLFLATGAAATDGEGTRQASEKAVQDALARLGVDPRSLVQVDGSGLSKANQTTAEQIAALVAAVVHQRGALREAILAALPVAGQTGSLKNRMRGTVAEGRVRAKTGWIKGSSGLSGVVETLDGREVVFSILVGYPMVDGMNTKAWKPMQDEICTALVEWRAEASR
ncbi:MAG: D-alanyl-D-alanine carboxypeptidase/D-alanyl-D-alanine-endopeptidase [Planctomycetota bacterium]